MLVADYGVASVFGCRRCRLMGGRRIEQRSHRAPCPNSAVLTRDVSPLALAEEVFGVWPGKRASVQEWR